MPETWVEHGIGETRAIVVEAGVMVEAHVEREDTGWRAGDVREVRLIAVLVPGVRGVVATNGIEAMLSPVPAGLTEGTRLRVAVVREALAEPGRRRLPKVVGTDAPARRGPALLDRLRVGGRVVREAARLGTDVFEQFGWSDVLEAALSGDVTADGCRLTISPTPAMTVIDVDGDLPPADLALAAADTAAAAIRLFDVTGSIGIDFPTVADRVVRTAIGARLDARLPAPFERTAINGFGFAQIVRPRRRPSFIETLRADRPATAALRLLRHAERGAAGSGTLVVAPALAAWLEVRRPLLDELARRRGGAVDLRVDPAMAISGAYVE